MKLLFLDIDGVLNDHKPLPNGYCGLKYESVMELCRILDECPDVKIVVSSAWRYMMIGKGYGTPPMTRKGFEYLFCVFGAPFDSIHDRIEGHTISDELMCSQLGITDAEAEIDYLWLKENGCLLRREQILLAAKLSQCDRFVVLDDLDLEMPELVLTDGQIGLTRELADEVIRRLSTGDSL